ncbi:MAG TPA: MFS transporter [Pseudonocardia sp.]|jgi:putative MFS transporter|nr:MFS transporter [Pseudonocardia sp.]
MAQVTKSTEFGDKGFLRRLTLATAWGEGLDGFDLGVLSVVLVPLSKDLGISPVWAGLIAASSLLGIFFGAPIGGFLSDRFGRKRLFLIDICLFVVLGVVQSFVSEGWQLFVVRLLLGVAIGAEYSIGSSMLSEFVPAHGRGRRVSYMLVFWYGGYLVSVAAAYGLIDGLGWSWRWTLATSAIPALIVLGLRIGLPESPRWLMLHGRTRDARVIIDRYLGGEKHMAEADYDNDRRHEAGWRQLFGPGLRTRTFFVSTFYICVVTPYFAIFTFAPTVFGSLKLNEMSGTIFANGIAFIGAIVGMLTIELIGRRKQLIGPFWIMAAALLVIGLWSGAPPMLIVGAFAVFAFFNAMTGNLTAVYPIEVFPTDVRATGVGIANAFSRVGAAVGTFLLPVGIESIGLAWCMVAGAAMCVIGAVVSQALAPETTGKSLTHTGVHPDYSPRTASA